MNPVSYKYFKENYNESSMKLVSLPSNKKANPCLFENVLASNKSRLIGTIVDEKEYNIITVDSDAMIRVWSLLTGECVRSYLIE